MLPREPVSAARTQQSGPRMTCPSGHLHTSPRLCLSGVGFLRFTDKVLYPLLLRKFPQRNVSIKLEKLHCFSQYSSPTKDGLVSQKQWNLFFTNIYIFSKQSAFFCFCCIWEKVRVFSNGGLEKRHWLQLLLRATFELQRLRREFDSGIAHPLPSQVPSCVILNIALPKTNTKA